MEKTEIKPWVLLKRFAHRCSGTGWEADAEGNWFRVGGSYHVFLWSRSIPGHAFESIVRDMRCSIRHGDLWKLERAACIAFICQSGVSNEILNFIRRNRGVTRCIALYDLGGRKKISAVESPVFEAFERFLEEEYQVRLEPPRET